MNEKAIELLEMVEWDENNFCPSCGQYNTDGHEKGCRLEQALSLLQKQPPSVVTLCGSTRFMNAFFEVGWELTLRGFIVLSVGVCKHAEHHGAEILGQNVADKLDELHLRKIDISEWIMVLDVDGYIGESTQKEINYAEKTGKKIVYLSECTWFKDNPILNSPDCQKQPPKGEFTKELRNRINSPNAFYDPWHQKRDAMSLEACDRLDQQAEDNKNQAVELKEEKHKLQYAIARFEEVQDDKGTLMDDNKNQAEEIERQKKELKKRNGAMGIFGQITEELQRITGKQNVWEAMKLLEQALKGGTEKKVNK